MIGLDEKAEILMGYFRDNKSQRAISRETGISRDTVSKYIKEFEAKNDLLNVLKEDEEKNRNQILLLIEEISSKPKYDASSRTRTKLTNEVTQKIDELVEENEKNRLLGRSKQLMKKIDIHERLLEMNIDISYPSVCNYIRENFEKKEAFIRQEYSLGETLEFDWGEVKLTIDGNPATLPMGLLTTACGSYHYARLYQNQKMENFLDIHVKVFNTLVEFTEN